MTQSHLSSTAAAWARFRFSVVGSLLSSPPAHGALQTAIGGLAEKTWSHPVTGREVQFSAVTIERWYSTALRRLDDPVAALRRAVRKDCGKVSLATALAQQLLLQYRQYPHWSYQRHHDNLAAWVKANPSSGRLPSYSTVKRYMQAHGWVRRPRPQPARHPGQAIAQARRQTREIRSYEAEYVGALWHRAVHRETACAPVERFAQAADVLRSSPSSESLRDAFGLETTRTQRQSDGTISLEGVRFEIPARYRHFRELTVRYARWDLGRVDLVDRRSGLVLAPIYPLDRTANADGRRAAVPADGPAGPPESPRHPGGELPPLLQAILQEYSATGLPPAYLPKTPAGQNKDPS
jgi:hypothetical protein